MNSLIELLPEILSYGAGGLTCKECGGKVSCPNVSDWLRGSGQALPAS